MSEQKNIVKRAYGAIKRRMTLTPDAEKQPVTDQKKFRIMLLTNRDSDNIGDQMIEACDIALIKTVMKNLNIPEDGYELVSRAASIVSKYVKAKNKDESLLKPARRKINECDLIIFGGAPVFNYKYQIFYERTAVTLELAQEYNKQVMFSAIGIEDYDEASPKCQRLKEALNLGCVKQITTRDGMEELSKYKENEKIHIEKVADPVVFAKQIFCDYTKVNHKKNKKVGLFVFREKGFVDNHIPFTGAEQAKLWKEITRILTEKGYNYELITSGYLKDEAFLDLLVRDYGFPEKKCVFNMNETEKLAQKIASYDAIISCRLHPNIVAYSMDIPAVSLIWNPKITGFYESIGYPERAIDVTTAKAEDIVEKMEDAMAQGIVKDNGYLMSVYRTLFEGIRDAIEWSDKTIQPYDYMTLTENLSHFSGTSEDEKEEKIKRKFRRTYNTLNDYQKKINKLNQKIKMLEKEKQQ